MDQKVLILDFGSQYTQLIARRVREANVYCEIQPYNFTITHPEEWQAIILSGSPYSVKDPEALHVNIDHMLGHIPVLAVCYGAQYVAQELGGEVQRSQKREYGKAELNILLDDPIFTDLDKNSQVWMSHADTILEIPEGFELLASTEGIPVAAFRGNRHGQPVYGLQFHPEVTHTLQGKQILSNFLYRIAGCRPDWTPDSFIQESVRQIKEEVGDDQVIMAISGGVDSTVCAYLVQEAIGDQLTCIFVDNGLLRKDEFNQVLDAYHQHGLHVIGVDARHRFWDGLNGVSDPETKRKIIGKTFIEVFDEEAHKLTGISWLAQGTIYPDVIESLSVHGPSATIKSHHNVGGLPDTLHLKLLEPLRFLFKDEVRQVGLALGVPETIISRHPFPGPGLSIRILGAITEEKIKLLQEADDIFIRNLKESGWYNKVWQAAVILLNAQSVGVMGDERTYEFVVALRAVNSVDGMTAEWSKLPHELLAKVSNEIINQVKGINRVVYDISTKPPATIEWE
ncbi:MAG TPA: glutamine-hydrolyzing GMP synthase [Saprospiraceae bacterium]|nr:glutamine-hydrolyzing GMP synthase [Saprospiraceae bacterium]HPG05789.1 glutamine-hydrolyzing GMP synthase [Saprospiraceae bacterium]HPR01677.1 glutamine-hydrolyzing GMP synthase [Saprospiraceae bacterium]HRV85615.1 glutamine-hydrolyzing GMP synthase [Saprospiraceae bacterium]